MKCNLIYNVTPLDGPMLDLNLRCLAQYYQAFDNKRVVRVGTGANLLPLDVLMKRWHAAGLSIENTEFVCTPNDEVLCETRPFVEALLPRVQSLDADEVTFYAHTKGITRPEHEQVRKWVEYLYRYNLSNIKEVKRVLRRYACAGIFKISQPFTQVQQPWHFSGTFFWFNHARLFSRDWAHIEMRRYGVESYLPRLFTSEEAYCLAFQLWYPYLDLYDADIWAKIERSDGELYPFRWVGSVSEWVNRFLHKR